MKQLTFLSSVIGISLVALAGCHGGGYSGSGYSDVYGDGYSDGGYNDGYGSGYNSGYGSGYNNGYSGGYNNGGSYGGGYNNGGSTNTGGGYNTGGGFNNTGGWDNGGGNGSGWNNEVSTGTDEGGVSGRDMVGNQALHEESQIVEAGTQFAAKYALSESTGIQIARTLDAWAALNQLGNRSDADYADFSKRLYGVDVSDAKAAFAKAQMGDVSGLDQSSREVAKHWGTTPEAAKKVLKNWYKEELKSLGVDF